MMQGRAADATAPAQERRHGLHVYHPRFLAIPGIGMRVLPHLLFASAARALTRMIAAGARFDAIDAHYFYPDGVAAVWLGRRFGLPVVVTARGSDVTQFPDYAAPRRMILAAAAAAEGIITVSAGPARCAGGAWRGRRENHRAAKRRRSAALCPARSHRGQKRIPGRGQGRRVSGRADRAQGASSYHRSHGRSSRLDFADCG